MVGCKGTGMILKVVLPFWKLDVAVARVKGETRMIEHTIRDLENILDRFNHSSRSSLSQKNQNVRHCDSK